MKPCFAIPLLLAVIFTSGHGQETRPFGLVIHGGAIGGSREEWTAAREKPYRDMLAKALDAGYAVLEHGGTSLDAVGAVIVLLEDSPLFNAGTGAVLNQEGFCELDASIMEGKTLRAGAVAGLQRIKNPIRLARDVMEKSPHLMMIGPGAESFAESLGHTLIANETLQTEERRRESREALKAREGKKTSFVADDGKHLGTVGAVALDKQGNLAAGTSTGGIPLKKFGRVGDSPIIGAGTYANNRTCAVSCTGTGEYFIRVGVARDVSAMMDYQGKPLSQAAADAIEKVGQLGGDGGLIAINQQGQVSWQWNTAGIMRAARTSTQPATVELFGEKR